MMERPLPSGGGAPKREMAEGVDVSPARKRLLRSVSTEDGPALCDRCRDIQWEDLAEIPPASRTGRKAADLGLIDRNALRQSSCPVCRLLADVTPQRLQGQHCRLVALSSSLAFLGRQVRAAERVDYSDCTVLFPVLEAKFADKTAGQRIHWDWFEGGCLALVSSSGNGNEIPLTGPRRMSATVDFALVKRWLQECETTHRFLENPGTCDSEVGGSADVQGLRVIDCHTRQSIEAPATCRYVALSYVWGNPPSPSLHMVHGRSRQPDGVLPRVVVDAMAVTIALGERYLWVDQLCIDQSNGTMKTNQIIQMNKIYAHAYLTIVAAAGQDASYGLPGVGDQLRHAQGQVAVARNFDAIQICPHTSAELDRAAWSRRGWTYQEGYLSPRRLIFTDHQVSYLCGTSHFSESIREPKHFNYPRRAANFNHIIPSLSDGAAAMWDDLKRRQLANYTRRRLTNECDSLNAILGIFRMFQPTGIRHVHGIPVQVAGYPTGSPLAFPLAWHHEAERPRRRCQFPSWSWSGWEGGIRMDESDTWVPNDCAIGLVERDGRVVSLQDWYKQALRNPDVLSENTPLLLRVTAPVVHVQCVRISWSQLNENLSRMSRLAEMKFTDGVHAVLPIREGVTQMAYACMDEDVSLDVEVLGLVLRPWPSRKNAILLLKQVAQKTQHYQRVGLVRVSGFAKARPAAIGDSDPQTVYVDGDGLPLDEVEQDDRLPIWLEEAVEMSVTIS